MTQPRKHARASPRLPGLLPYFDGLMVVLVLFLVYLLPEFTDRILIALWVLLPLYVLITGRARMLVAFVLSSMVALIWLTINVSRYTYNHEYVRILGLNAVGLLTWALGLFACYMLSTHLVALLSIRRFPWRLAMFSVLFWVLLLVLETLAFHVFGVQNQSTGSHIGLPICDCLHAPPWMQACYFLLGPAFYAVHEGIVRFLRKKGVRFLSAS